MQCIENPTSFPPVVQSIGYLEQSGLLFQLWCAHFPTVVNTWHHNFFPAGTSSRQDIPVLPTQTNRTCQANKETQPKSNVAENPSEQVSELFFYYAKCSKSYSL